MSSLRRRLLFFSTRVKSIPICGAVGVPHCDCVPHRELNDTVISHIFHNLSFVIYVKILSKVSLYKKLMALLPASEGCAKEEGSLSTTQVGNAICKKRRLSLLQVINSLGDFKPLVEQASVENLLRLVGMRYRQNITKSHFLNRCFFYIYRNLVLLLRQHPDWGVQGPKFVLNIVNDSLCYAVM